MAKNNKKSQDAPDFSVELVAKLKTSDPDVQTYVSESRKRISELVTQNVKLHLDKEDLGTKIKILEKENKRLKEENENSVKRLLE